MLSPNKSLAFTFFAVNESKLPVLLPNLEQIKHMPVSQIIARSELEQNFKLQCQSPELVSFWEKKMEDLFRKTFAFFPLKSPDMFTQYCAQYYYNKAIKMHELESIGEGDTPYLLKAIEYQSFQAAHELVKRYSYQDIQKINDMLSNLGSKVKTPILLLYVQAYLNFVNNVTKEDHDYNGESANQLAAVIDQAYIYLCLAEKMQESSSEEIHNFTYGLGLAKIFPCGLDSFNKVKEFITSKMNEFGVFNQTAHLLSLQVEVIRQYQGLMEKEGSVVTSSDVLPSLMPPSYA